MRRQLFIQRRATVRRTARCTTNRGCRGYYTGENSATTVQRNGKVYGVVTQNYAIFPESAP